MILEAGTVAQTVLLSAWHWVPFFPRVPTAARFTIVVTIATSAIGYGLKAMATHRGRNCRF